MSTASQELNALLRPAGGGVFLVSTGRAEQLALQRALYDAPTDDAVAERHAAVLAQVAQARAVMLGIPSDVGAGFRRGANMGPQELRRQLLADSEDYGAWARAHGVIDVGDVLVVPQLQHDDMLSAAQLQASRHAIYGHLDAALRDRLPVSPLSAAERVLDCLLTINPALKIVALGGDHSAAWPVMAAVHRADPRDLCVLQFDAHTDLLRERLGVRYCFATWSYHANDLLGRGGRLVQVGIRATRHDRGHWEGGLDVRQFWADECVQDPEGAQRRILEHLERVGCKRLYISNDIDGTDEAWASATGTPEPNGLHPDFVEDLILRAGEHFEIVAADIMEVAPTVAAPTGGRETTLALGARYLRASLRAMLGSAP